MMKNHQNKPLALLATLLALAAWPGASIALDFEDVKPFEEVFVISAQALASDRIEVSWEIAPDHYLYNNRFLQFSSDTPGVVLGTPEIPEGERSFDELLGEEVIKFHGRLAVVVPVLERSGSNQVTLDVRSQGCLDKVLCYPPTVQTVSVELPSAGTSSDLMSALGLEGQALPSDAIGGDGPLEAYEAFVYEAIGLNAETLLVRFTIQPGYYLYRDKFDFRVSGVEGVSVREVALPGGVIVDDPEFGRVEVFRDQVEIPVRVNRPAGGSANVLLEADFQGCKDGEICYPPETRTVKAMLEASAEPIELPSLQNLELGGNEPAPVNATPVSEQSRLAAMLTQNPGGALLAFFVAGLLLAFTPCVFPMVPILSGIIIGQGDRLNTARAFWLSLIYVLAMALTYTVAGVLAGMFGKNLQAAFQNPWIIGSFVAIFVALAFSMFGFFELQLPSRLQSRLTDASNRQSGGNLLGVAAMGVLSALIVGPCVAPPLAAALIVIGSSGDPVLGGSALFALSMGMGVPLIVFGVSAGKLVPRAGAWMDAVKAFFGVGLLALAIWMLERIVQGPVILLLWGLLMIGSGVYLGALERIPEGASGWRKLWKSLGVALLVLGSLELIGAATGQDNWMQPIKGVGGLAGSQEAAHVEFQRIKSLDDLDVALASSSAASRPTMLDFYADWCVECIRMERNTFPDSTVMDLLDQFQSLQADVTPNDDIDQALMRRFDIIGPPAILFFDRSGNEMEAYRLVGYFTPDEFSAHLRQVLDGA